MAAAALGLAPTSRFAAVQPLPEGFLFINRKSGSRASGKPESAAIPIAAVIFIPKLKKANDVQDKNSMPKCYRTFNVSSPRRNDQLSHPVISFRIIV